MSITPSSSPAPTHGETCDASCTHDPHDHTGHDHPPTGAQVVDQLVRGLSIVALVLPALAVVMLLAVLAVQPSTPLPLLIGITLGAAHLLLVLGTSVFVSRTRQRLAVNPALTAVRSVAEELLRLCAFLLAGLLWPEDPPGPLGLWVGAGAALVWIGLATIQTLSTRRRLRTPSDWGKQTVAGYLGSNVSVTRSLTMRVLDVAGTACFQLGATVLVFLAPVMVVGTMVLSIATGLSTLVLQRHDLAERSRSWWAFAPAGVGALTLGLGLAGLTLS